MHVCCFCCIYYKVQTNEVAADEEAPRSLLWRKARANKKGEFKNEEVKHVAEKIVITLSSIFLFGLVHC